MGAPDIAALLRDCMMVVVKLGTPILGVALAVGLLISFIQAITQINEATLSFVPKLIAIGITLTLLGPFMASTLADFARRVFDQVIVVGGS